MIVNSSLGMWTLHCLTYISRGSILKSKKAPTKLGKWPGRAWSGRFFGCGGVWFCPNGTSRRLRLIQGNPKAMVKKHLAKFGTMRAATSLSLKSAQKTEKLNHNVLDSRQSSGAHSSGILDTNYASLLHLFLYRFLPSLEFFSKDCINPIFKYQNSEP